MASEPKRDRLPFEPQSSKKAGKKTSSPPQTAAQNVSRDASPRTNSAYSKEEASLSAIPDIVSKRMVRRMALFSGIPTAMGVASFFIFYWIVSHGWFKVPTSAVALGSMGLFGLGVVGLSYGILSASWDEERIGSWLGWREFSLNFGRMVSAWKAARQEAQAAKGK